MKPLLLLMLVLSPLSAPAASPVLITCEPTSYQPWPENPHVKVRRISASVYTVAVSRMYYGIDSQERFQAPAVQAAEGGASVIQIAKDGSVLSLWTEKRDRDDHFPGRITTAEDGTQDLDCQGTL